MKTVYSVPAVVVVVVSVDVAADAELAVRVASAAFVVADGGVAGPLDVSLAVTEQRVKVSPAVDDDVAA